ncbi:MAG: response regulator transcription factor [Saprospiraceae bacterium]|nr:response regulator transcription factor [Saprospiraceae bacterium]
MTKPHLLYVEDDETLGFVTRDNLEQNGFNVTHLVDGKSVLEVLPQISFDLAILDVMLPEVDGFTLAKKIRETNREVPILFLTAKSLKEDRLKGFETGADDYITKPYSIEELIFRIQVFLKRSRLSIDDPPAILNLGGFSFDHENLLLSHSRGDKVLTQKEADVLKYLILHQNQVCKRKMILEDVWGEDDYFMGRSLDVFISRLRKYLANEPRIQLNNIHGVGFKLKVND